MVISGEAARLKLWNKALRTALIDSQRQNGHSRGSWDTIDAWSFAGGRIYTTAMAALCLEAPYRYDPAAFADSKKKK